MQRCNLDVHIAEELLEDCDLKAAFAALVRDSAFPCLGAKAAFNGGAQVVAVYDRLASDRSTGLLAQHLEDFTHSKATRNTYATYVAIFRQPQHLDEENFEKLLWSQLHHLDRIDAQQYAWDPSVSSDPADPRFSFSFAGKALYVVGLHARSSRFARQFPWPTLVFNPHEQFERLRHDGKWKRMQGMIRARDRAMQGNVNPMLSDFGKQSEARQYSGRPVEESWRAPFRASNPHKSKSRSRCPFGH
jgi:uncharacterized protein